MLNNTPSRRGPWLVAASALFCVLAPQHALAQGFISPSLGYNFAGVARCRTATDCENKNWNWGVALGALGSIVGFEGELTYDGEFTGSNPTDKSSVLTVMGNFMIAPKITIVQPYGLAGIGLIKTDVESKIGTRTSESKNQIGWTIGGGVIIYLQQHIGLKGDIRHYHAFQALELLGIDLARDQNKIDFGRVGFGVVFKF